MPAPAHTTSARRNKIVFQANVTQIVLLDRDPPTQATQSQFSGLSEYMYTVNEDADVIFASEGLHAAILDAEARAGDALAITRRQTAGRPASWVVQRAGNAAEGSQPVTSSRPAPEPVPPAAPHPFRSDQLSRPPAPQPIPQSRQTAQTADILASALVAAVEAAALAELRAREHGMAIRFQAEDIRALAATMIIDRNRQR